MKINKNQLSIRRPMAIAVAVSAACQIAYANSPFVSEPLHLIDKSTTTTLATAKPKVMLFIDDSGSMRTLVPGTEVPCKQGTPGCRYKWVQGKKVWGKPKNRIEVVQDAVNTVLDEYGDKIHWNIFSLWGSEDPNKLNCPEDDRSRIVYPYMNTANLRQYVSSLDYTSFRQGRRTRAYQCDGYTPATIRYLEAAKIVRDSMDYKCQTNTIVMLSDGDANGVRGYNVVEDPYYGLPRRGTGRSDYENLDPNNIYGSLPDSYAFNGTSVDDGIAFFSHKLLNKDLKTSGVDKEGSPWDGDQIIETYTVGFGGGLTYNGKLYLEAAGAALPDKQGNPVQTYFEADDAQKLVAAFQQIFKNINDRAASTAAAATTSVATPSNASSSIANMAATMTLDTGIWGSEIKFNKLDQDGNPVKTPAGEYVSYSARYIGRKVLVNNGQNIYWLDGGNSIPNIAYADFGFPKNEEFRQGFIPWYLRDPSKTDEQIENDVNALNLTTRVVSMYRKRTDSATAPARQMGDVLDSSVVAMNENAEYVAAGANDGMVYIFKSTGALTEPYELKLNYVPAGMERESTSDTLGKKVNVIADANYGNSISHIYGVNGGISYTTTAKTSDRQQRTLILGAMGQGARGIYALNISGCERQNKGSACIPVGLDANSATWDTSVPLWESEKGVGNLLGYTVGTPGLYQVALDWQGSTFGSKLPVFSQNVILAGFVSNGYPSANKALPYDLKPTLYVYNVLGEEMGTNTTGMLKLGNAGEVIHKIPADSADGPGALASPVIVDVDFDGVADVAYAGDYFGDLYRFDLRDDPTNWVAVKIYDGDSSQPITAAPAVYRNNKDSLIIAFGTGSNLYESDLTNTNRQGFFGIYDDLTDQNPQPATVHDLIKQDLTKTADKRNVTDLDYDPGKRGWWFELDEGFATTQGNNMKSASSEQVVTQPQILLSTVFFTTRIYKNDKNSTNLSSSASNVETCQASTSSEKSSGTSWLMGVDVRNGGKTKTAKFRDKDDPNKIDHSSGHDLGVLASQPNVVGGQLDAVPNAINENAQVGNGVQLALKQEGEAAVELRNDCLVADNYHAQISKASQTEPLETFGLTGPLCEQSGRLIRINTREIK